MRFNPAQPFNDLPRLPPLADLETKSILKQCTKSRVALMELAGTAKLIPNQSVLINTLPMLEARASSEIENIVTTTDRLFQYAQEHMNNQPDHATKEALRYRTALYQGFLSLANRPLVTSTAINVCSAIKGVNMDVRKIPGTALLNDTTGSIIYTPPEGENNIRDLLTDWERFLNDYGDLDPLIAMAITHYQFEAIHPFSDGNGRTGRIINLLFLVQNGLLQLPILYLSRYIIEHKADYYRLLLNVTTHQAWEEWVMYMLLAVESTATWTLNKIHAIKLLMDNTIEQVRAQAPKIYSRELVELIFTQPYCRISNVVDAGLAARHTASKMLKELVDKQVLVEVAAGREKLFINPRLMRLLTTD